MLRGLVEAYITEVLFQLIFAPDALQFISSTFIVLFKFSQSPFRNSEVSSANIEVVWRDVSGKISPSTLCL